MNRNTRDNIAEMIAKEKGLELLQVQVMIERFLQLTYEEGYVVTKPENE